MLQDIVVALLVFAGLKMTLREFQKLVEDHPSAVIVYDEKNDEDIIVYLDNYED